MKLKKLTLALFAGSALALTGCVEDGKDGVPGPQGTAGIQGEQGAAGTAGVDGKNASGQVIFLERVGRTASQGFDTSAAEITAYDKVSDRIFVVNAQNGKIDVFNNLTASTPTLAQSLELGVLINGFDNTIAVADVKEPNSVAVNGDLIAVAVANADKTKNGWALFLNRSDLTVVRVVEVGALPDMLTFTPDGAKVLVANEGEPALDYSVDPEGSVSVITLADYSVVTISFTDFNEDGSRFDQLDLTKIVLDGYSATNTGNKATVAQSFEPEYITVSDDGAKAFVALQENNAIAVINLANNTIDKIFGLGFKDHSIPGNEMDAGDEDGPGGEPKVNIRNWPVKGIYMPDAIDSFTYNGKTYLITANEGDSREDWLNKITNQASCEAAGYYFRGNECLDEVRVKHLVSRAGLTLGADLTGLDSDDNLGRLKASYHTTRIMNGNSRADGTDKSEPINTIYAYGARSFSIWDTETGEQIFDSGSDFERITANRYGVNFNNNNTVNSGDSRSDDKGPEPEGVTVGKINGYTYAFIGLERIGGVMVYDISNPFAPSYVQYVNNRDFTKDPDGTDTTYTVDAGDFGPEGIEFIPATDSPDGKNYLIVANEKSGTNAIFEIKTTNIAAE
jgi:hypothetical protein